MSADEILRSESAKSGIGGPRSLPALNPLTPHLVPKCTPAAHSRRRRPDGHHCRPVSDADPSTEYLARRSSSRMNEKSLTESTADGRGEPQPDIAPLIVLAKHQYSTACRTSSSRNSGIQPFAHIDICRLLTAPAIGGTPICELEAAHGLCVAAEAVAAARGQPDIGRGCHKNCSG
jgi:hypothetical protein